MKRNKIKMKYLNQITEEKISNFDKLTQSIFSCLKCLGWILLLLLWGSLVPLFILELLRINYKTLSDTSKIMLSFLTDLLFILLLIKCYYKTLKEDFKNFFNRDIFSNLKIAFRYWGIGMIVMVFSNMIISLIKNGKLAENEELVRNLISVFPVYMGFQLIVYAPLTEELIFRKSIRDITEHKWLYVFLSGFIFGSLHVLSSLESLIDFLYLIPYCSLGFAFALLYTKTNNIFSSMVVHAFHNGLALVILLSTVMS